MAQNLSQGNFEKESGLEGIVSNRPKIAVFSFFFLGLFLLALGVGLFLFRGEAADKDIEIISATDSESAGEIIIHVDGAVTRPGVYKLKADSRVNDAINAAGGLSGSADQSKINLAAKITDGQKIYVPKIGESTTSIKGSTSTTGTTSEVINVNTASESELDKLPGVGPVTAAKIIASRPYSSLEELLTKKAVSSSVYEKIKGLIAY